MGIDSSRGFVAIPRGLTDWEWYSGAKHRPAVHPSAAHGQLEPKAVAGYHDPSR